MSKSSKGLTVAEHVEVGALLKEAHTNLLIAAKKCRVYGRLSQQLAEIADSFMSQRAWLEQRLIDAVGKDATISGVHCRDVYFGTQIEEEV
jgi:hypothetical protein